MMTALYSINLHVMGKSNLPLLDRHYARDHARTSSAPLVFGGDARSGRVPAGRSASATPRCCCRAAVRRGGRRRAALRVLPVRNLGTAMQATGDNPQMIRALGVNVDNMTIFGLALSNGLIALSRRAAGAVSGLCRRADGHRHGRLGLASIIIGEALVGVRAARPRSSPAR